MNQRYLTNSLTAGTEFMREFLEKRGQMSNVGNVLTPPP